MQNNKIIISIDGETKNLYQWSKDSRCLISYPTLKERVRKGWDLQRAVLEPPYTPKMKLGDIKNDLRLMEYIGFRKTKKGNYLFGLFTCQCGNPLEKEICKVFSGEVKSCGCAKRNQIKAVTKHGMTGTITYNSWNNMIDRCTNVNQAHYKAYGGKGIVVCEEWLGENGFKNFYNDMGERPSKNHSLDKLDDYADYCKSNCRWATQQQQNESKENNSWIRAWGEWKTLLWWFNDIRCNATIEVVKYRLWKLGWSTEKAIETVEYMG